MINKQLIKQLSKEDIEYITQAYIKGLNDLNHELQDNPSLHLTLDTAILMNDQKTIFEMVFERMKL